MGFSRVPMCDFKGCATSALRHVRLMLDVFHAVPVPFVASASHAHPIMRIAAGRRLSSASRHWPTGHGHARFPQRLPGLPHNGPGRDIEARLGGTAVPASDAAVPGLPGPPRRSRNPGRAGRRPSAPPQGARCGPPGPGTAGRSRTGPRPRIPWGRIRACPETAPSTQPAIPKTKGPAPEGAGRVRGGIGAVPPPGLSRPRQ